MAAYRIMDDTSTRASVDPKSEHYEEWVHFRRGQRITVWPEHAPIDDWVASGHWRQIVEREPAGEVTTDEEVTDGKD